LELYGKEVNRRKPFFVPTVLFTMHKNYDELVRYEFFLLWRPGGAPRATVLKQWTVPAEAVYLASADSVPFVQAFLQYTAGAESATVTINGLKQPITDTVPLPRR